MNLIGTKNIETERCKLRRIIPDDYSMMYENWAKFDEVCKYYPFNPVDDIEIYRNKVKHWISNYEYKILYSQLPNYNNLLRWKN